MSENQRMEGPPIQVRDLSMGYGDTIVQRNLNFEVQPGEIFVIMGGSGCGKSTLLRHLIALMTPIQGQVLLFGKDIWEISCDEQAALLRHTGVMYQYGALWSSMTLFENIALPLQEYTDYRPNIVRDIVQLKLALVGLEGHEQAYPRELSGGMRKRAALARAMALDPQVVFLDEPSAGLDPVTSRSLDQLILELRESAGQTFVVVTHELESIFTIASRALFLDAESKTQLDIGPPRELLASSQFSRIRSFLSRGGMLEFGMGGVGNE